MKKERKIKKIESSQVLHSYFCFILTSSCNSLIILEKFFMNHQQQLASSRNLGTSLTLLQVGYSKTTFTFSFFIIILSGPITTSKNPTCPVLIKSLSYLFIIAWNIASEFVNPKNMTVGSNNSSCKRNSKSSF